jgi:hypothetical protein
MLSSTSIVQAATFHLTARLDAEVSQVARAFTMCTDDLAAWLALGCKGGGGSLEALFLTIANKVFLMLDGSNDGMRGEGRVVIRSLDHGLQLGVMLPESINKEYGVQMITIKWADRKNSGMEGVEFLYDMAHCGARMEVCIESFGNESDLGMCAEILVAFAEGAENRGGSGEIGDNLVVGVQNVLEHECLQGSTVSMPSMMSLGVGRDVRLWEGPIKPFSKAVAISDQHHLEAPFLPIGLRMIEAEIRGPGRFGYELHGWKRITGPKRGNGGQKGSLGGHHRRHIGSRA